MSKCVVSDVHHKNCTDKTACFADPVGLLHGPVELIPCPSDAVAGSRFC